MRFEVAFAGAALLGSVFAQSSDTILAIESQYPKCAVWKPPSLPSRYLVANISTS